MNKVNVIYDIDKLKITIKSKRYTRVISCQTLDSYIEEIRRLYVDLKGYSKSIKESD